MYYVISTLQYSDSIRQSLHVIAVAMAAYGDGYHQHNHSISRALSSMLHSGKYMINPELRAQRINELTQDANIDFCKAFWSLTDEYGVQVSKSFSLSSMRSHDFHRLIKIYSKTRSFNLYFCMHTL